MNEQHPIGLTKGPGETPHEFTFVSPDRGQVLKASEFVAYQAEVDGQERAILARVTNRRPLRLYPDTFLADPSINPDDVAALVGYHQRGHELFELTATVIGYYDEMLGDFINPRLPPRTGRPIYLAADEELARVLTKKQSGEGSLLSRDKDRVPVTLDLRPITSTHLAIIASTGAGKSYLAAVLIEEMMKPNNRAAILVVDPHGEYDTLAEMMNHEAFVEQPPDDTLQPAYRPEAKMEYLLRRAYRDVREQSRKDKGDAERWTPAELQIRLRQLGEGGDEEDEGDDRYAGTADALIWRLESVLDQSVIFDDFQHLNLAELFQPGRCSVLQLNEVDEREQRVMVATLLRRLFRARTQTAKGQVDEGDELYLPYPAFVLIEEAHRFAPASGDVVSTVILKQVLAEGRKFGVAVGLISQRPGKLDGDVLSQCNTQFILRIVNPVDQARVAESVETVGRDLLRELPALTKGQVIVAGEAVNTPLLCRVRTRHTRHGAETRDAPADWMRYFEPEEQSRRERETALPVQPRRQGESKMFK
jgi:DNA helicase HerA-like ATPase